MRELRTREVPHVTDKHGAHGAVGHRDRHRAHALVGTRVFDRGRACCISRCSWCGGCEAQQGLSRIRSRSTLTEPSQGHSDKRVMDGDTVHMTGVSVSRLRWPEGVAAILCGSGTSGIDAGSCGYRAASWTRVQVVGDRSHGRGLVTHHPKGDCCTQDAESMAEDLDMDAGPTRGTSHVADEPMCGRCVS